MQRYLHSPPGEREDGEGQLQHSGEGQQEHAHGSGGEEGGGLEGEHDACAALQGDDDTDTAGRGGEGRSSSLP